MTTSVIQASFHAGEWAPQLYARVDLAKYKAGAAVMRNFFVDYRGGASTRPGTQYIATAQDSVHPVRLIPFQATTSIGYILEFGHFYIRWIGGGVVLGSIVSPYDSGNNLWLIKYTQDVDKLILCHPNYPPQVLTLIAGPAFTIAPITFGTTVGVPTGLVAVVFNPGPDSHWSYVITAVDANGQESQPSASIDTLINNLAGQYASISLTWAPPAGPTPAAYNVYRSTNALAIAVPAGVAYGYVTTVTLNAYTDVFVSNQPQVPSDFSVSPPIAKNPIAISNPTVPGIFQQRLVLAGYVLSIQGFQMSQTGFHYNFDVSNPVQADNGISATLSSGQLNSIKSMVNVPNGLLFLTDRAAWLVNSGSGNAAVSPIDIAAHTHSYIGASDLPPIVANFDILFVQAKNSIIRDMSYNWMTQIYTGTDISVLSSHLFYGQTIVDWGYAEEPYKLIWAIRDDGVALSCTFTKEQDLIGWARHDTQGAFLSVAVITETNATSVLGLADFPYFVVQRVINGNIVKYIERMHQRFFFDDAKDAWCVDAGLKYNGPPATSFSGAGHLANAVCTGLADGVAIPPFAMTGSGTFGLSTPASKVIVGLAFTPQLQTLPLDTGDPTIQGKRKSIGGVNLRVQQTLGLTIGKDFSNLVAMKDLARGHVGTQTNEAINGLVTGDARTIIDPSWDVPGQYSIQQSLPYPATVLGVMPEIEIGDTPK